MIIVGKSLPHPEREDLDEVSLQEFGDTLAGKGYFAYAWDFNPHEKAIHAIRDNLPTWLYLIHRRRPWFSRTRMRIRDFRYSSESLHCPEEWKEYCPVGYWCLNTFQDWIKRGRPTPIHLWFLVDQIVDFQPQNLRDFPKWFPEHSKPNFWKYGQGYFAFLRMDSDC